MTLDAASDVGMVKIIRLTLRPGHREEFLLTQAIWNRESRAAPDYLGEIIGDGEPGEVYVLTFWRSRAGYEEWMETEHDRIAALASSELHYQEISIAIVDRLSI